MSATTIRLFLIFARDSVQRAASSCARGFRQANSPKKASPATLRSEWWASFRMFLSVGSEEIRSLIGRQSVPDMVEVLEEVLIARKTETQSERGFGERMRT